MSGFSDLLEDPLEYLSEAASSVWEAGESAVEAVASAPEAISDFGSQLVDAFDPESDSPSPISIGGYDVPTARTLSRAADTIERGGDLSDAVMAAVPVTRTEEPIVGPDLRDRSWLLNAANAFPAGYADEAVGLFDEEAAERMGQERAIASEQAPNWALAGDVAGTALSMLALGPVGVGGAAARALGRAAPSAARGASALLSRLGRTGQVAAGSAAYGAARRSGEAEGDVGERLDQAADPGGVALDLLAGPIDRTVRRGRAAFRGAGVDRVHHRFTDMGIDPEAGASHPILPSDGGVVDVPRRTRVASHLESLTTPDDLPALRDLNSPRGVDTARRAINDARRETGESLNAISREAASTNPETVLASAREAINGIGETLNDRVFVRSLGTDGGTLGAAQVHYEELRGLLERANRGVPLERVASDVLEELNRFRMTMGDHLRGIEDTRLEYARRLYGQVAGGQEATINTSLPERAGEYRAHMDNMRGYIAADRGIKNAGSSMGVRNAAEPSVRVPNSQDNFFTRVFTGALERTARPVRSAWRSRLPVMEVTDDVVSRYYSRLDPRDQRLLDRAQTPMARTALWHALRRSSPQVRRVVEIVDSQEPATNETELDPYQNDVAAGEEDVAGQDDLDWMLEDFEAWERAQEPQDSLDDATYDRLLQDFSEWEQQQN